MVWGDKPEAIADQCIKELNVDMVLKSVKEFISA